jgi:hypothetical protein
MEFAQQKINATAQHHLLKDHHLLQTESNAVTEET